MNGTSTSNHQPTSNASSRSARPAPTTAPPAPPAAPPRTNGPPPTNHAPPPPAVNGTSHPPNTNNKGKKKTETPVDPATMYESVKSRIAALEEEEVLEEEEERRMTEEARKALKGRTDSDIHAKYIELFAELKRLERDHAKEKQKLTKDKDSAKNQLTKANQTKAKMENLARELQKDNKRLREDGKRLAQCIEDAQDELMQMKSDISKRADKAKLQDAKYRETPDIVVKVVCRYRAELFFKISRKTKLSRLFNAWTDRMERNGGKKEKTDTKATGASAEASGPPLKEAAAGDSKSMQFIFTYNGRSVEPDQSPEDMGMEDGDEIVAVELMDLTEDVGDEEWDSLLESQRPKLAKNWTDDPAEAKKSIQEIFDGVVRERLKEVLRQYELRERHFECVIRSKELEVLLSRARAAEQKQLAEGEKTRADTLDKEVQALRRDLDDSQTGQTMLIDKLIQCCKEIRPDKPNPEKTQRLFMSLRDELEKRANSMQPPAPTNGQTNAAG